LRERKRYLAFEVVSSRPIADFSKISSSVNNTALGYLGQLECAKAGIMLLKETYDEKRQRAIIRVSNKYLDKMRAVLALVKEADGQNVILRSTGVSGMLTKTKKEYVSGGV
jgi:RNase P/RNase MRP subunit POP5